MGLFDQLGGVLKSALGQGDASSLISSVLAKSNFGGLQGLVAKLQQGGLGDQVGSWLGQGANAPVSADQLHTALGSDHAQQLANHFGGSVDDVLKFLAKHLPGVVDQASPDGTLPPVA